MPTSPMERSSLAQVEQAGQEDERRRRGQRRRGLEGQHLRGEECF